MKLQSHPGKADKLKTERSTYQTRTLNDYLKNLHHKFLSENPGTKLSLASFCRIRPNYIRTTSFISRNCCLCTKHQNMTLCIQALKSMGVIVPLNPENFIDDEKNMQIVKNNVPEKIKFCQWKRVAVEHKGRKKMVMKIVDTELEKSDFLIHLEKEIVEFC